MEAVARTVDRAMQQLEERIADMAMSREQGDLGAGRIWQLAQPLLTYIRLNKGAIIDYGARYRSGRRIATALAKSVVNSVAARRMVKKQQMRWSKRGAHLMLQVRAAVMNGNLREQLCYQPPIFKSRSDWLFKPTPPPLRGASAPVNLTVPRTMAYLAVNVGRIPWIENSHQIASQKLI
jgi:hypothetical protein